MVSDERMSGIHFGRDLKWEVPEMKTVVFCFGSRSAWKNASSGDGAASLHGSKSACGKDEIELDTSRVMFSPARIDKGPVLAFVNRIRSDGVHPGTETFHSKAGTSSVTGYGFTVSADAVINVPSPG